VLELKNKAQLSSEAFKLAQGQNLVRYHEVTYIPVDYETRDHSVPPDTDRTIWLPVNRKGIQRLAAETFSTLFVSDGELAQFDYMVAQHANQVDGQATSLLVRTPKGLRELDPTGTLVEVTGEFRPNALVPMLNEDQAAKDKVFAVMEEWLNSEEEVHSLLRHLATSLAPGWSAVKYVLLLGEGRNGKGLLLRMLSALFGIENISSVTRQAMSEKSPVVTELNGKLLNIIYDGQAEYVKDSGIEKTLVAGEPASIRKLYESTSTVVQTNALFIESLNQEPKTGDKSSALQKRLVRFQFPNIYALNHKFARSMLAEESLGAFMSLLFDHYVEEDDVAAALAPTTRGMELQLEQMYANSIGLQFLRYLEETDALGVAGLVGSGLHEIVQSFQSWRIKENDLGTWAEPDVERVFTPLVITERKSVRVNGKPRKVRVIVALRSEAAAYIASLKGEATDDTAVVDE
jgi:hypothetical protein